MGKEFIVVKYALVNNRFEEIVDSKHTKVNDAITRAQELKDGYIVVDEENNLVYPFDIRRIRDSTKPV